MNVVRLVPEAKQNWMHKSLSSDQGGERYISTNDGVMGIYWLEAVTYRIMPKAFGIAGIPTRYENDIFHWKSTASRAPSDSFSNATNIFFSKNVCFPISTGPTWFTTFANPSSMLSHFVYKDCLKKLMSTTLQSMTNATLSQRRFWHCHENGLTMTIPTVHYNLHSVVFLESVR